MSKNFSDRSLPLLPNGDESPDPIWLSVGRALSAWEELQNTLGRLFAFASNIKYNWAVIRGFGMQMNVGSKLDMIQGAAEVTLLDESPELLDRVFSLNSAIRGLNERRNDIAHGHVFDLMTEQAKGYYLGPAETISKKNRREKNTFLPPAYCWTAAQVDQYTARFEALRQETIAVITELNDLYNERKRRLKS